MKNQLISIVLPVFNEEAGIQATIDTLLNYIEQQEEKYELIFVDDGSKDKSVAIIKRALAQNDHIKLVEFSRNFGHQLAITAGLEYTKGDAVVVMDADLQDPPEVIPQMIKKWHEGYQIVYGKRMQRDGETVFKKFTAKMFYRTFQKLATINMPLDTGDFRLMDRRAVQQLLKLHEKDPFVRGQVTWIGFKQTSVLYHRQERIAGETKYPLSKMIKLAVDGITSFSMKPLHFVNLFSVLPLASGVFSLGYLIATNSYSFASIGVTVLLFTLGLLMLSIGILGSYLGRVLDQVNNRPRYIVSKTEGFEERNKGIHHFSARQINN
ncbi:glycosyltransferase family 2 protein [Companilactobacillus pabuli]|jgi:dolichol-phosphate mannosyltransferase|uniref:Glycosyltransferase family 2 protein n=1 Tax=Companilactobacillus pabuli TaxID=2714036 RepID=A0A7L7L031_9LACO|nr:glycosyltransferase family 2 protein [Companilactobacillus pabuli]AKP03537.1 glycosyltransferase [Companilactobacillus farciminis]AKS51842.1 glycosyltransferase [Companilactobacillus farciminis]MDG5112737.1 glycosyltransferase family 2 protein [Companilactobacillus pabuli]QMT84428.1 glycosyltransferase family 2 protein [Companilactobacillus pabuli]GAQ00431.1 glycosyltransferase [Companilactobacillus farciminis]